MLCFRNERVYACPNPSSIYSNPDPQDVSVTSSVIKSVLWGEILDPGTGR